MVLSGTLPGGARMPSSRTLADRVGVSRFTVVTALDQLVAEGYLRTSVGSGTFVEAISNSAPSLMPMAGGSAAQAESTFLLSSRAQKLSWLIPNAAPEPLNYLHMSVPDHRLFPVQTWTKLTSQVFSQIDSRTGSYRETDEPSFLEQQIAAQIALSRGIRCDPEEVVTTFGAHHAVNLLTELLLDPTDCVAFEEPGMSAVRSIFQSHGCKIYPMYADIHGADPSTLPTKKVKLAFVTAAKQQPLNVAMPAKRKLELLGWSTESGALIIEDDLSSDFRYQGRPIPPLKAMDQSHRVIFIGSFSMSLLQTLRVGYMIMPRDLATQCRKLIQVRYRAMPQLTEQVLARFIAEGHFTRHLHKARRIYAKRQERLLEILDTRFADVFDPPDFAAGFYNLCYFKDQSVNVIDIFQRCRAEELGVAHLSQYYWNRPSPRKALLIGFASSTLNELEAGTRRLRDCVTHHQ